MYGYTTIVRTKRATNFGVLASHLPVTALSRRRRSNV
jgi:hypothetical protein